MDDPSQDTRNRLVTHPPQGPTRAVLAQADRVSAVLMVVATFFAASALFSGARAAIGELPALFPVLAPLVAIAFGAALFASFFKRERHGAVRTVLAVGSVTLAIGGIAFAGEVRAGWVLMAYWVPAVLGIAAAGVLVRAHQRVNHFHDEGLHPSTVRSGRRRWL
jgi:hypothetical protein